MKKPDGKETISVYDFLWAADIREVWLHVWPFECKDKIENL